MAALALALPASEFARPLFAEDVSVGNDPLTLWGSLQSGLAVPRSYLTSALPGDGSSLSVLITPESLGTREDQDLLARAAWQILLKADPQGLVAGLLRLAHCAEFFEPSPEWHLQMAGMLDLQASRHAAVGQYIRSGRPLLFANTIRWIAREIAAVSHAHTSGYQTVTTSSRQLDYFGRAWFRSWGSSLMPSDREIITAIWILHDSHKWTFDSEDPYESMAGLTYGVQAARNLFSISRRYMRMWQLEDDHPALGPAVLPSQLRERYRDKVGSYPEEVIVASFWIIMMHTRELGVHEALGNPALADEDWQKVINTEITSQQWDAIENNLVVDFETFAKRCHDDGERPYAGLGKLPYADTLPCRIRPLIRFDNYSLPLPYSPALLMEQTAELHRWTVTDDGLTQLDMEMTRDAGELFQAYIHTILCGQLPRYRVLPPNEFERIAKGRWRSCDFAIVAPGSNVYLFVEAAADFLGTRIADGQAGSLDTLRAKYSAKAEQIVQSMNHGLEIAEAIGALPPRRSAGLVVVERTLYDFPEYGRSIADLDRQDIRVVGIDEFELLLQFGDSVAIPEIVYDWTRHRGRLPLGRYLSTNVSPSGSSGFTLAA